MAETFDSVVSNFSEQTKKLEIATHYTFGDVEKAKLMVAGTYKDIYAIKARFSSSSINGAFLIFFNLHNNMVNSVFLILSHSYAVAEMKTNTDWRAFERQISDQMNQHDHDDVLGSQIKDAMMAGFTMQFNSDLKKLFESGDEIAMNRMFQKFVKDRMGFQNIDISVDYEPITSVDMELYSTSSVKISAQEAQKRKDEEEKKKRATIQVDEDNPLYGREVRLIIGGNVLLSPIKGKDIADVSVGDKIKIAITDMNPKAIQVAKAFNAYSEGNFLPISGRVIYIKHLNPGYKIYAVVAKGIYVKIDEEEESIKIAMERPHTQEQKEETSSLVRIGMMILVIIASIAIIAVLVAQFL
ncbi:MAG: hypothetical protein JXA20_15745 [Spirochaetes bacterium]|nr:hypothetical protein [Spirochaetota bacterium]